MSSADQTAPGASGIEQIRALMRCGRRSSIVASPDFNLVEIAEGRAVFEGTPGIHAYNPIGSVRGGYVATLLDSACGMAVHSKLAPDQAYTTLEIKVAYHRAMNVETGLVRAEATVVSFGGRTAFAEARLTDTADRLLASATSTLLVFQK